MVNDKHRMFLNLVKNTHSEAYSKSVNNNENPDKRVIDFDHHSICVSLDLVDSLTAILDTKQKGAEEFVDGVIEKMVEATLVEAIDAYVKAEMIAAKLEPDNAWVRISEASQALTAMFVVQEVLRHGGNVAEALLCMKTRLGAALKEGPALTNINTPNINVLRTRRPGGMH